MASRDAGLCLLLGSQGREFNRQHERLRDRHPAGRDHARARFGISLP